MRRVVVTGIGALTPIGNNLNDYWTNLKNGLSGAAPITKFDTTRFKTTFACELKGYDPKAHFDVKEIRKYDPFSQYALVAVDEAVRHGKIDFEALNQGTSGPNTAEFRVYDDKGTLVSASQWNLGTGFKATILLVKE